MLYIFCSNTFFFKIFFDRISGGKRTCAEKVVSAAVAASAGDEFIVNGEAGLLGKTGKSVKFAEDSDNGFSASVSSGKSGFNSGKAGFNLESEFFKKSFIGLCGFVFLKGDFRKSPYFIGKLFKNSFVSERSEELSSWIPYNLPPFLLIPLYNIFRPLSSIFSERNRILA